MVAMVAIGGLLGLNVPAWSGGSGVQTWYSQQVEALHSEVAQQRQELLQAHRLAHRALDQAMTLARRLPSPQRSVLLGEYQLQRRDVDLQFDRQMRQLNQSQQQALQSLATQLRYWNQVETTLHRARRD